MRMLKEDVGEELFNKLMKEVSKIIFKHKKCDSFWRNRIFMSSSISENGRTRKC